jgi:hypothetical protein
MIVNHHDAVREFAYGAEAKISTFPDTRMADQFFSTRPSDCEMAPVELLTVQE